ncbi:MAG TPA: hypothetical protein PKM16_07425 [Bacteroidia bacterium]|nr:hypothetical protein [Bacteroidia bacterium]
MELREIKTSNDEKQFIEMAPAIYSNIPEYIRPLDKDIKSVFDPAQNKFFRHGKAIRWILLDGQKVIGRIAAFIDEKQIKKEKKKIGGIGFFECIDNERAATHLFDQAKDWLVTQGMTGMDGPINFGERDAWWGLIVEGFDAPIYRTNFNPPYYKTFFESYGFKTYFEQYCYSLNPQKDLDEKFFERHKEVNENKDFSIQCIDKNNLDKYADDFTMIYNKAWVKHGSGKSLETKQMRSFFKKLKPVMDGSISFYAYYKEEPIAFFVNLPDINQIFKKFDGKFGLLEKLRFLWMMKRRASHKMIGLVFGVIPEFQGKGVDSYLIVESSKRIKSSNQYNDFEMQWVGDFNPKMIRIAESLGTYKSRTLITYRKLFDENEPFERHPIIL